MEKLSEKAERIWKVLSHFEEGAAVRRLERTTGLRKSWVYKALQELESKGFVDHKKKLYIPKEVTTRAETHPPNIDLKHFQRLVQKCDCMNPIRTLRLLAFGEEADGYDVDYDRLRQHLKTGYYEISQLLDAYKQRAERYDMLPLPRRSSSLLHEVLKRRNALNNPFSAERLAQKEMEEVLTQTVKFKNMESQLARKIFALVDRVKHDGLLDGYCDAVACPSHYLSIKET